MARFTPGQSVANQIRSKVGVNMGGASGRPKPLHMGVTGAQKGGLNVRGSGPSAVKPVVTAAHSTAVAASKPDPYRSIVRNGQRVLVRSSRLTPAELAALKPSASPTPAPTGQPAATPTAPGPLDYRNLSSYMGANADLDLDLAGKRHDISDQLAENSRLYARETADTKDQYGRSIESGEDDLNHGGLLRSGVREVQDADRFKQFDRHLADIEQQYGSVASAKLNDALHQLAAWEAQQRQSIEAGARDEYGQMYPAMPVAEPVAPVAPAPVAPAAPAAKPKPSTSGIGTVPKGTPPPAPSMTLKQAAQSFDGRRTHTVNGRVVRTSAYTNYLKQQGLL